MLLDISTTACIAHQQLPNVFQLKMPWPAGWLMHVCNPVLRRLRQEITMSSEDNNGCYSPPPTPSLSWLGSYILSVTRRAIFNGHP